MGRIIAIADIHGHSDMLVDLLDQLRPQTDDQLVFLGDYIDRGPDSPTVLEVLIAFQQQFPQTAFLRGNHEQMLLDAVAAAERKQAGKYSFFDDFLELHGNGQSAKIYYFVSCGGHETLAAYSTERNNFNPTEVLLNLPSDHLDFLQQTRFYHLQEQYMFVHAGVDPKDPTGTKRNMQAFLWQRKPLWKTAKNWHKVVVHGHTPVAEPYFHPLEINLDTGAGYGAYLTACDVRTGQFWTSAGRSKQASTPFA